MHSATSFTSRRQSARPRLSAERALLRLERSRGLTALTIGGLALWAVVTASVLAAVPASAPAPPFEAPSQALAAIDSPAFDSQYEVVSPSLPEGVSIGAIALDTAPNPSVEPSPSPLPPSEVHVIALDGTPITSGPDGGPLNTAGADVYDCEQFGSWAQLLAVFLNSGPGDPNRLDTLQTGNPCSPN